MVKDQFIDIQLNSSNIDIYLIRSAILSSLIKSLPNLKNNLLDIGCGKMPYKQYILANSEVKSYVGLDLESALVYDTNIKPDYTWDGITMPFTDNSFDCAMATEVLEHCPEPEIVLKETLRILKPGGVFFFTVPFLWNLHEVPHDEYRYTPFSLERHLRNAGFSEMTINATGGWHAAMAQMIGLWVKRAPISKRKSRWLANIAVPIMKYLVKIGNKEQVKFKGGQMITGLFGIAKK